MTSLVERLRDLIIQATTERSHFYTANLLHESIQAIEEAEALLREARMIVGAIRPKPGSATWNAVASEWDKNTDRYFTKRHPNDE